VKTTLLDQFRRRIHDVRYSRRAFGLSVNDPGTGSPNALAEITSGRLIVTVMGIAGVPSVDIDLSNPNFDTVAKLRSHLDRTNGYRCSPDEDIYGEHPSLDLEPFGPTPIVGTGIDFKHRNFSDLELQEILTTAVRRHNPSLVVQNLPPGEEPFVMALAHAEVCRVMAYDASKRKGTEATVESLIALADSMEGSYREDVKRIMKALTPAKESDPATMREGDVISGMSFRASPRTGFRSPLSQNTPPDPAVLFNPGQLDIEDDNIRVNWQRNRTPDFYAYELWMDTRPEVQRAKEGQVFVSTPFSDKNEARKTTSKMIFRSFGGNSNFDLAQFATFVEQLGQGIVSFVIGSLEPEFEYFFRLYVMDLNYEGVSSQVVSARTKPLRVKFNKIDWASTTWGPAGTSVVLKFDSRYGVFTSGHKIEIGGKPVTPSAFSDYQATITIPSFFQLNDSKNVTVTSPNGLIDTKLEGFKVTT